MKRKSIVPRQDWQRKVYNIGLTFHTDPTGPYWTESAYYEFDRDEISGIERATAELYRIALVAMEHVVRDREMLKRLFCRGSDDLCDYVEDSWKNSDPSLYL
jgi:glutathionylspermidine synthase